MAFTAAPVFTYGPASNYRKSPAVPATPASTDLLITPTDVSQGIPAEGIDFFMGPDMQASINKTLDSVCADDKLSQQCIDSLSTALNHQEQYAIESRVVGIDDLVGLALMFVVLTVAVGIELFKQEQPQRLVSHFHLESTDVAQLQSMTESSAVIATSTGASDLITLTVAPSTTVTSVEPATMITLSADASGHHSGDVLIALPTQPANLLEQILRRAGAPGTCKSQSQGATKRQSGNGPNFNAINNIAVIALPMAAPGQLLDGLGMQALDHVPHLKDAIDQASLEVVQKAAAALEQFKDVAASLTNRIAEAVWTATYDMCVLEQIELSTLVLEDSMITDDPAGDENPGCTTDVLEKPACSDPQCAGEKGKCSQGDDEGCTCLRSIPFFGHPGDTTFVHVSYGMLTVMAQPEVYQGPGNGPSGLGSGVVWLDGGSLACKSRPDQGNTEYFSSLEDMNSAASKFCQDRVDEKTKFESPLYGEPSINLRDDNGVGIGLSYNIMGDSGCPMLDFGSPGALEMCNERFGTIINNCDTSNPKGVERWKSGGGYKKYCVVWSIGGGDDSL
ncbi:hypothetical protein K431DRAFT_302443 [Polychaeton citri CBS 116435]|uniref:Uncharacterized protein n=1 Tax=Polychaeton citri CBS 116435 TaxID=1314669 RepID=A0A9P4UNP9_9PEZI|nr:hypothetical protein K431DRAFT_302443 [Polychaeton citri CBS 116435]